MNKGFISYVRALKQTLLKVGKTNDTDVHITIALTSKQGIAAGTGTARAPVAQCVCLCVQVPIVGQKGYLSSTFYS